MSADGEKVAFAQFNDSGVEEVILMLIELAQYTYWNQHLKCSNSLSTVAPIILNMIMILISQILKWFFPRWCFKSLDLTKGPGLQYHRGDLEENRFGTLGYEIFDKYDNEHIFFGYLYWLWSPWWKSADLPIYSLVFMFWFSWFVIRQKTKRKKYDLRKMSSAVLTKGPGPLFDVMSEKIITLRKTHRDFRMDLGKKLSCW